MPTHANLASKYRPILLKQLVGQETVVDTVQGMLESGKVSRTILITGPWGSGKTTIARLIARYLNCLSSERENLAASPCGECEACSRMDRGALADYSEFNSADSRGIDDIRKLIDQVAYKPQSKYRIVVLDEVHQLTPPAFQALLKVLEEPPSQTIFMLCTTDPGKIPPAVRSRCKKLLIEKVKPEKIVKVLRRATRGEGLTDEQVPDKLLEAISTAVDGHPRDALMALEAVLDRIQANGGADKIENIGELVLNIADEVAGDSQDAIVGNFLFGLYKTKYTRSLLALRSVARYDTFVDALLQYHKQTMFFRISKQLHDPMYNYWYEKLKEEFGKEEDFRNALAPEVLGTVFSILMHAGEKVKSYAGDPEYLLLDATVRSIRLIKSQEPEATSVAEQAAS